MAVKWPLAPAFLQERARALPLLSRGTALESGRVQTSGGPMRTVAWVAMYSLVALGVAAGRAAADDLKVGDPAPDFTLKASDGRSYTLSQMRGKEVVLAWFPKAFTAG